VLKLGSMRIAIVGTGVSGLACAHLLHTRHDVTVFEADSRPGGHTHTVRVALPDGEIDVDTGFIVYNERTYPGLVRLFEELGVATQPSDMSFSVSDEETGLEYRGTSPNTVFAQRRNVVRPDFLRMLREVGRFNRQARALLEGEVDPELTLGRLLARGRWSQRFVDWYLVPLGSSIWSADPRSFTEMPAATLARFFDRHGLLSVGDKPEWRTVTGGSARYVEAVLGPLRAEGRLRLSAPVGHVRRQLDGVVLRCAGSTVWELYDHVILATHSDQALDVLDDASPTEKEVLGAITYQRNDAVLHTDLALLPRRRRAWASWNFHRLRTAPGRVTMTYDLTRLQALPTQSRLLLTLNREEVPDPATVLRTFSYEHPVLDSAAVVAQGRHGEISGHDGISYCGAYWGAGFHEDGFQSGLRVCQRLGAGW